MINFLIFLLCFFLSTDAMAIVFCKRFPSDTPVACYGPDYPPPSTGGNVGIGTTYRIAEYIGTTTIGSPSNDVIDSNGNIGIGNSTPASTLEVNGQITMGGQSSTQYGDFTLNGGSTANAVVNAIPAGIGGIDSSALFVLPFDNSLTDLSPNALTFTNTGTTFSNSIFKFGSYSLALAGGQYITTPQNSIFNFGTGAFTIDFWMYATAGATYETLFEYATDAGNVMACYYNGTGTINFQVYNSSSALYDQPTVLTIPTNTWTHIAFIRGWGGDNTKFAAVIGGVQTGSITTSSSSAPTPSGLFYIGRSGLYGATHDFIGNIDEFRVSNTARWTANFTPPASAYTSTVSSPAYNLYNSGVQTGFMKVNGNRSNNLELGTASSTQLAITTAGNVGVGSVTPGKLLDVAGTSRHQQIIDTGLTASKLVFTDANKQLTSTGNGTSSQFEKGDNSLDSTVYLSGNQTITLSGDITGSGSTAITTTLKNTGTAGTYRSTTFDAQGRETSGTNPTTFSGYGISDSSANLRAALTDSTGTGVAVFGTSPNLTANVGIGSATPGQALDVQGTIRSTQFVDTGLTASKVVLTDANKQLTSATNLQDLAYCQTGGTNCPGTISGFGNPSATVGTAVVNGSATTAMRSDGAPAINLTMSPTWTGNHIFAPGSGNTVFTAGNVGIGSATPGKLLDVAGIARMTGFVLSTSPSSGYVLTSDASGTGTWVAASGGGSGTITSSTINQVPYFTAATTIAGSSKLYNNNTNIGIGTSTMNALLTIGSTGQDNIDTSGNVGIGTTLTTTSALTVMSGNVGVGTWVPSASISVVGTGINTFSTNVGIGTITATSALSIVGSGNNTFSTNVGIGTILSTNRLDVAGGVSIGTTNAGYFSAPSNGLLVQGNVGIGSVTPGSGIDIASAKTRLTANNHLVSTASTAPTVANNDCGSTSQGTIVAKSSDVTGTVTVGTLTVTSCAVTFATAWTTAPNCLVIDDTSVLAVRPGTVTTTKLTINSTTSMSGDNVTWMCIGNE